MHTNGYIGPIEPARYPSISGFELHPRRIPIVKPIKIVISMTSLVPIPYFRYSKITIRASNRIKCKA